MASISGLGSGLDVESIISQLMAVERLPEQRYTTLKTQAQGRQTAWQGISTQLAALDAAAQALSTPAKASVPWPARPARRSSG